MDALVDPCFSQRQLFFRMWKSQIYDNCNCKDFCQFAFFPKMAQVLIKVEVQAIPFMAAPFTSLAPCMVKMVKGGCVGQLTETELWRATSVTDTAQEGRNFFTALKLSLIFWCDNGFLKAAFPIRTVHGVLRRHSLWLSKFSHTVNSYFSGMLKNLTEHCLPPEPHPVCLESSSKNSFEDW